MANHKITLLPANQTVEVPTGSLVAEAIQLAGLEITQPCGGQGRCGRCAVFIQGDGARRRSTLRLSAEDLDSGYALACQTVVEGDLTVTIPEQERIERRLVTDKTAKTIEVPFPYEPGLQGVRAFRLYLQEPSLQDNKDDLGRLQLALAAAGYPAVDVPLTLVRRLGSVLRACDWSPWVVLEVDAWNRPQGPARLIDVAPDPIEPVAVAIDIGTTTVSAYLVDLTTGEVLGSSAEYNGQIQCGEDVISRIIYAGRDGGLADLGLRVRQTIAQLLERLQKRTGVAPTQIYKATVAGNTTMTHLFLGLPPASIRLAPYIPTVNMPVPILADEIALGIHPLASVDCLPGVASYVGSDITAGVLACGLSETDLLTLFIDVGTNGEIVLGTHDWQVACACSAGPAFETADDGIPAHILTALADIQDADALAVFGVDIIVGGISALAPNFFGGEEFDVVVLDVKHRRPIGFALDDQRVVTGFPQMFGNPGPDIAVPVESGQGRLGGDNGLARVGRRDSGDRPQRDDEFVLRAEGIDPRVKFIVEDFHSKSAAADPGMGEFLGE